jgi:NodT family efflux transporter outer membrane factor (OMF) lipoprotein
MTHPHHPGPAQQITRAAFAAFLAAALGACATVGPDVVPPVVDAPDRYADWHGGAPELAAPDEAARVLPFAARWNALGDAGLQALLRRAAQANHDVQASALRVLQARALERTARAGGGPALAAAAGATRERLSEDGAGTRLVSAIPGADHAQVLSALAEPFTVWQAGFDASWEPDFWGRVRRSVEAAQAQGLQAEADARQMRLVVAAEVARGWFELRSSQRQLAIARGERDAGRESEQLLRARADEGLVDESAWLRQHAQDEQLEVSIARLSAREAAGIDRLALLCGERPGALDAQLAPVQDDPGWAAPDLGLGVPGELARRRPDVASAEQRLAAATAAIGIAMAELYPRVTLGARFGYESLQADRLADWSSRQWSIGPSLDLPLFDGGRRRATVRLRELQQQEAAVAFRKTVLAAWHDVDTSVSAYRAEQAALAAAQRRVDDAEAALGLARARAEGGLTDDLPALAALRELAEARLAREQGRERVETALVAVWKALGEGPE